MGDTEVVVSESDPKLRDATKVGQLVRATTEGSRYVCVLVGTELNVAVRLLGNKLSVRVEPVGNETLTEGQGTLVQSLGMDNHDGQYASYHLTVTTAVQAVMAAASVLAAVFCAAPASVKAYADFALLSDLQGKGA